MDSLPQELIDEIIGQLPLSDKRSLANCALVARSWRYASERSLFESVEIPAGRLLPSLREISKLNGELLQHVRRLTSHHEHLWTSSPIGERGYEALCDDFRSLSQLRHLTLCYVSFIQPFPGTGLFSAFKPPLTSITLSNCSILGGLLVALINYFPNLQYLGLLGVLYICLPERAHLISRLLLKKLTVDERVLGVIDLLEELWKLGLHFDEVDFGTTDLGNAWIGAATRVMRTFGVSAERLNLPPIICDLDYPPLSQCLELRELELEVTTYSQDHKELNLISSVASKKLEKITLNRSSMKPIFSVRNTYWAQLDSILVELVGRLGHNKLRLEVEFRGRWSAVGEDFDTEGVYLPKFVASEMGRMTVWGHQNPYPIYRSGEPGEGK